MKKLLHIIPFFLITIFSAKIMNAQNWLTSGNSGLTTSNFLGSTGNQDVIFKANNTERGRLAAAGFWRLGTATNYAKIDSTGKLTFGGTGVYQVAGNKYAFQYTGNPNYGLFFNSSSVQYEFRNGSAIPVFSINANTGNSVFNGTVKVGAYTLPATDGTNGQVLKTNGSGGLTWSNDNGTSYTAGTGISISGTTITNTAPDKTVVLTAGTGISVTGTYPGFTISNTGVGGWALTGNAGTNPSVNFIGTTDANPLVFRVNNVRAGFIDYDNTKGNTSFGYQNLISNIGTYNTAFGYNSLYLNTSGSYNTGSGTYALYSNTTGYDNTANGSQALYANTTGYYNTANGYGALISNTTGYSNTANGADALYSNTTGFNNAANGAFALNSNTTGMANTANGLEALTYNTIGSYNTANGYEALYSNTTGYDNTANGVNAGYSNSTGFGNFFGGYEAGYNDNSSYNTMIGFEAGYYGSVVNGSNNTYIGYFTGPLSSGFINSAAIGSGATPTASYQMRFGDGSVSSIGGIVGWSTLSDGRFKKNIHENVHGLDFIKLLRPVTYTLDIAALNKQTGADKKTGSLDASEGIAKQEKNIYTGFVAQEVEAAAKKVGYNFSGVDKPKNDKDIYGLRYSDFVVPLVKAVQELSTQNDSLKNENASLRKDFNDLKNLVLQIQQQQQTCGPCSAAATANAVQQNNITFTDAATLGQNAPNPFNSSTIIKYYLPSQANNAELIITDANGNTLKSFALSNKGAGQINISAGTLSSGSYFYSLLVDGKKIDTKQMILTK